VDNSLDISIIIPCYNEEESLMALYDRIVDVLKRVGKSFEIIFIDDGSDDNSHKIFNEFRKKDPIIKIIEFRTNCGKAKALSEGFKAARGSIVLTMDADLQDDPEEIPNFIEKLEEGYDLVSGWKKRRKDPLEKTLPSKIFNKVVSLVIGINLHDFNCGFKAYRRELIKEINIYGDLHRYIPALAYWKGFRIAEIPIQHYPRKFGKSKYGWKRYFQGFFDLFTVVLLTRFMQTPLYLFGRTGLFILFLGSFCLLYILFLQVVHGSILGHRPLSYFGVLSILFGTQLIATGLIAEMLINFRSQTTKKSIVRRVFSFAYKKQKFDVSIIISIQNEIENIESFYQDLNASLSHFGKTYEIVFIIDASSEGSIELIKDLQSIKENPIKIIHLPKHLEKDLALQAGVEHAYGNTIVTMESDQQFDPNDIISLLNELDKGAAMAIGIQKKALFPKSFFSKAFNRFVSYITGVKIHDPNCSFRAFRKDILTNIGFYGQQQRLLPIIIAKEGYHIVEVPVSRRKGIYRKSKSYFCNISKKFLDLIKIFLITDFQSRPLHMFGLVGVVIGTIGLAINLYLTVLKIQTGHMHGHYTLLLSGVALMIFGLQWFSTGLLGELINNISQARASKKQEIKNK